VRHADDEQGAPCLSFLISSFWPFNLPGRCKPSAVHDADCSLLLVVANTMFLAIAPAEKAKDQVEWAMRMIR
jgi:hypothetical protein